MQLLIPSVMVLIIAVPISILLGFLLVISPLMVWLNLRRLRKDLHADLLAIREGIDRLAGVPGAAALATEAAEVTGPAAEAQAQVEAAPDKIGFSCPECGKFFEGAATLAGTTYTCPECHVGFHIH